MYFTFAAAQLMKLGDASRGRPESVAAPTVWGRSSMGGFADELQGSLPCGPSTVDNRDKPARPFENVALFDMKFECSDWSERHPAPSEISNSIQRLCYGTSGVVADPQCIDHRYLAGKDRTS